MAMISRNHAQISIMKCATTTAASFVRDTLGCEQAGNTHDPASRLPARVLDSKRLYAPFRNPWAWWVSWYCHAHNSVGKDALAAGYGRGRSDFRSVLEGGTQQVDCEIPECPGMLAKWGRGLADDFRASGEGLYSWMAQRMLACGRPVTLLDVDSLSDTLPAYLGLPEDSWAKYGPRNTGAERWRGREVESPADPLSWYDDEMISWVWDAESWAVNTMAYEGPFEPAYDPVVVVCIPPMS